MTKKIDTSILIISFIFMFISVIAIYSSEISIDSSNYFFIKQIIWYLIGYIMVYYIVKTKREKIYNHAYFLYILGNILLIYLLLLGNPINDSKCWIQIKGIGTIQPSEFVKIILIIVISKECATFKIESKNSLWKNELILILKTFAIIIIPSILTFLEPDTGVVIIYIVIALSILFISGIRYRWFIMFFLVLISIIATILSLYFYNKVIFINIFGNSFFLRINRLLDWSNKSGYQLTNSITSIGSSGLFGRLFNSKLYIPESHTDFIFSTLSSSFGIVGSLFTIAIIVIFDIKTIKIGIKTKKTIDKYIIAGITGMLIYQQFQNISMTIGIMPITGITLPFISYGGSSLLSYMLILGLILNISKD